MKKQSQQELDILGVLTKIQEQIAALDKKVDSLMNRSSPQAMPPRPPLKPSFPPNSAPSLGSTRPGDPREQRRERPMYRAMCADCKKECELPFKPSGERPVYCKECFARRKANNIFKTAPVTKPQAVTPFAAVVNPVNLPKPIVKEKKKPSAAKKSSGKKKPVTKKKKKKSVAGKESKK